MKLILSLLVLLATVAAATAIQEITVVQGQSVTLESDTGARGTYYEITAIYRIPDVAFTHQTKLTHPDSPIITDELRFDLQPGSYRLLIDLYVDGQRGRQEELLVHVTTPQQAQQLQQAARMTAGTQPVRPQAPAKGPYVLVPAIPDVTADTTIVLPVTITGTGIYQLAIPELGFATYEIPGPVSVSGNLTVPILLHVNADARPGTYAIPVSAGGETATARIRVIEYVRRDATWAFAVAGAVLIVAGIAVLLLLRKPDEPKPRPPNPPKTDEELISYY